MELRRGMAPDRYRLWSEGREIGAITAGTEGSLVARFHGFADSSDATSAAWLAHAAQREYRRGSRLRAHPLEVDATVEGVARLTFDDGAGTWAIELPLGPASAPDVFTMASTRRMWETIRRSGLRRRMTQFAPAASAGRH